MKHRMLILLLLSQWICASGQKSIFKANMVKFAKIVTDNYLNLSVGCHALKVPKDSVIMMGSEIKSDYYFRDSVACDTAYDVKWVSQGESEVTWIVNPLDSNEVSDLDIFLEKKKNVKPDYNPLSKKRASARTYKFKISKNRSDIYYINLNKPYGNRVLAYSQAEGYFKHQEIEELNNPKNDFSTYTESALTKNDTTIRLLGRAIECFMYSGLEARYLDPGGYFQIVLTELVEKASFLPVLTVVKMYKTTKENVLGPIDPTTLYSTSITFPYAIEKSKAHK